MRIRLKQSFHFHDRKDVNLVQRNVVVMAHNDPQEVPNWIQNDPAFELLEDSGHLEIIQSRGGGKLGAGPSGGLGLAGGAEAPQVHQPEPVEETLAQKRDRERVESQAAEIERKAKADLEPTPKEDDPMKKSSGQDGDAGDWTKAGRTVDNFPVPKGHPEDVTATPAEKGAYTKAQNAQKGSTT